MANLRFTAGPLSGTSVPLERQTTIGRDPAVAQVVLADDDRVSREHARISPGDAGVCVIRDLGSTNGTWLIARDGNRRQLTGDHTLQNGDQIEIGGTRFTFSGGEMGATMLATSVARLRGTAGGRAWFWISVAVVGGIAVIGLIVGLVLALGGDDAQACDRETVDDEIRPSIVVIGVEFPGGGGTGSGFALTEDGYIMTNRHVVEDQETGERATSVEVALPGGGRVFQAQIIEVDDEVDLALIKTEADPGLTPIRWADPDEVDVGLSVTAAGFPLFGSSAELGGSEVEPTFTFGQISAKRLFEAAEYLQHGADINPGNSGGPLVNDCGEVVGVNAAGFGGDVAQGIYFAVASSVAEARAEQWLPNR